VNDDRSLMGLDYTHMFTPTLLVELRTGYSRNTDRENSIRGGVDYAAQLVFPTRPKIPI